MMYDDLIKSLRVCGRALEIAAFPEWDVSLYTRAADAIEELQKQLQKSEEDNINLTGWLAEEYARHQWISVTERLPDESFKNVLCCGARGGMFVGWVATKPEDGKIMAFVHGGNGRYITHWMPLPEPPESEE